MKEVLKKLGTNKLSLNQMNRGDYVVLVKHKCNLLNKRKIHKNEFKQFLMFTQLMNSSLLESKIEDLKCNWDLMAADESSTTFEAVRYKNKNHPLWNCAYNCDGLKFNCGGYIVR